MIVPQHRLSQRLLQVVGEWVTASHATNGGLAEPRLRLGLLRAVHAHALLTLQGRSGSVAVHCGYMARWTVAVTSGTTRKYQGVGTPEAADVATGS